MSRKKIVFLTGAGIDAESGIPTFRSGTDSLWENHKVEDVATYDGWKKNKELVLNFYNERRTQMKSVEPNIAHTLIAKLEREFEVLVITTNVTDLHERGGSSDVMHLHGELNKMCSSIDKSKTLPFLEDIKLGDKHEDGSQLRPFIVWFGEDVPLITDAIEEVKTADYLVIVGTSLEVYPAAGLMRYAKGSCELVYIDPFPNMSSNITDYFKIIRQPATIGVKQFVDELLTNEEF